MFLLVVKLISNPAHGISIDTQVHPSGRWLHASNRDHNSLGIVCIEPLRSLLSLEDFLPSLGVTPRSFAQTASGELLLDGNQDSDHVVAFKLDPESGLLSELKRQALPTPVCIICCPL